MARSRQTTPTTRAPLRPSELAFNKPLCAALDGFTLHAATRAGALDTDGREKLLRYVLRWPEKRPFLVFITPLS